MPEGFICDRQPDPALKRSIEAVEQGSVAGDHYVRFPEGQVVDLKRAYSPEFAAGLILLSAAADVGGDGQVGFRSEADGWKIQAHAPSIIVLVYWLNLGLWVRRATATINASRRPGLSMIGCRLVCHRQRRRCPENAVLHLGSLGSCDVAAGAKDRPERLSDA
ncbi:hypothetical protein HN018_19565 [Lichenicola cladoniae]|uniref:Uncharacterized protein n=1 Tax=Lichenicola cladoniae TaxID=1484109 RepID=A0A6M8HUV6_9PROT|nr:hypothetical protein [Lichenicola cladoniae]NPD66060.1 hypothetical protein [Acetobacteraceae bacterium]QKE91937.1 hypothetical protein HN018_19565 [Lichenicola cladoniae]